MSEVNYFSESTIINADSFIIKSFEHSNIIGFGEGAHGLENFHQFFIKMLDNVKIQEIIDVLIVEFANTDYQDILDEYIFGKNISIKDLRKIWRESTQSPGRFGEHPVYLELLKKIREINLTLPEEKKIRVIGGDPSIDWKSITTWDEYAKEVGFNRIFFPAKLAIEHGINCDKKVLLIYSGFHLVKINDQRIDPNHQTITTVINNKRPNGMKVIEVFNPKSFELEEQVKGLPLYSILDLSKDKLGNFSAEKLFSSIYKNGKKEILFEGFKVKELFDAFLYVGQNNTWEIREIPITDYSDEEWIELNRRRCIASMKPLNK